MASSTGRSGDSSTSSSTIRGSYSLVSVAAAMYLMTSIAAADLGAGIALLCEARTEMVASVPGAQGANGWRWVQRKMFGLTLLLSFALLATSSIRVLFYSSIEDVDLVVGAATILFIADVDEKVMVVLRVIPSKWRLFCVLEVIGLSATFALLGLRATGNGGDVSENYNAGCNYGIAEELAEGCYIYSWLFIFSDHPLSVTVASLLVNAIVASPKGFMVKHVFGNCSQRGWLFALLLVLWILGEGLSFYFKEWLLKIQFLFIVVYATGLVVWLLFLAYKHFFCERSQGSAASSTSFRWTWSSRFGLLYVPVGLFLFGIVIVAIATTTARYTESKINVLDPTWDPFLVTEAFGYALYNTWLMWGLCRKDTSVASLLPEVAVPTVAEEHEPVIEFHEEGSVRFSPLTNIILGWALAKALFISRSLCSSRLVLPYIERTGNYWALLPLFTTSLFTWTYIGVCAAASNTKGVAFWAVATWLLYHVAYCIWVWNQAVMYGSVQ